MHGGYRRPADPAPVSGPGALSQRTDGGPSDPRLMERPPAPPPAVSGPRGRGRAPSPGAFDAFRPSDRPAEPITAGIASGPGPSPGGVDVADADRLLAALMVTAPAATRATLRRLGAR